MQLDFYPSFTSSFCKEVSLQVAMPALLYQILPLARDQQAGLTDPGTSFPAFIRASTVQVSESLLRTIERNEINEDIIEEVTFKKSRGKITKVDWNSNNAKWVWCRMHGADLPGCFFPKAQLSDHRENPECWGCRLRDDLSWIQRDSNGLLDSYTAAHEWLAGCEDLASVLERARTDPVISPNDDQSWTQIVQDRENARELRRLKINGKLPSNATSIPARMQRFAKVRSSRYDSGPTLATWAGGQW